MSDENSKLKVSGRQSGSSLAQLIASMPGAGDPTMFVNGVCALSTPAGGSGLELVSASSGPFSAVPSVNMPLPSGAVYFDVEMNNLMFSDNDKLAFAVSTNGGTTWLNDSMNYDSYTITGRRHAGEASSTEFYSTNNVGLNKGDLKIASPVGMTASFRIYPGSSTIVFQMKGNLTVVEDVADRPQVYDPIFMTVNPLATTTPVPARVTNILWFPCGNGDTPPTAGLTMSGNIFLYKAPTL